MSQDKGPPDLERCMKPPIKESTSCKKPSSSEAKRSCLLAVQHLDGCGILISIDLEVVGGGKLIFSSAKQHVYQALAKRWHQRMIAKLSMSCVAGTARIKQVGQNISWADAVTASPSLTCRLEDSALRSTTILIRTRRMPDVAISRVSSRLHL